MADLDRSLQRFDDPSAALNAVVDCREAVQHGAAFLLGNADAVFAVFIAVLSGIAVDGGGEQVCFACILQVLQQFDVLVDERNARSGLGEGAAFVLGLDQLSAEPSVLGDRLLIFDGFLEIHVLAGGPLGEDFRSDAVKFVV